MYIEGIGKFNLKPVAVEYCIELNDSTFFNILKVDWGENVKDDISTITPLSSKLLLIDGIQDVDYEGTPSTNMLGANIFITVDNNINKNKLRKSISEKIIEHLELLRKENDASLHS